MGERHELDFYESPYWYVTEALKVVNLEGVILEVCAGGGAIASLLKHLPDALVFTNDIDPNKPADFHLDATLPLDRLPECDWIITNPPYADKAAPVVKNAYNHAKKGIVMFLLSSFLEPCGDRSDFLSKHPPTTILSYPRYCFRKDKRGKRWATDSGTINCFIWDKSTNQQIVKVIPQDSIQGFYKNPSQDIGLEKAISILKKQRNIKPTE